MAARGQRAADEEMTSRPTEQAARVPAAITAVVVAVALAGAGCGGGGDDPIPVITGPTGPTGFGDSDGLDDARKDRNE